MQQKKWNYNKFSGTAGNTNNWVEAMNVPKEGHSDYVQCFKKLIRLRQAQRFLNFLAILILKVSLRLLQYMRLHEIKQAKSSCFVIKCSMLMGA